MKLKGGLFPRWLDRRLLLQPPCLLANVTVAQDGSGHYKKIAEAIKHAPSHSKQRYVIHLKARIYRETVHVSHDKINLMFIGDGIRNTTVISDANVKDGSTTFRSATFAVAGKGFIARDMTFANNAGPSKHQAVALRVSADFSAIYRCNVFGYQNSLYAHSLR